VAPVVTAISGQFLVGQQRVGQTLDVVSVVGVPSAQAFGVSIAEPVTVVFVGGVASAQGFGTLRTVERFGVLGVPTAQAFGSVRSLVRFSVGGVASAQAFGSPLATVKLYIHATGLPSAQAFGVYSVRAAITIPVAGFDPWFYTATIVGQTISGQRLVGGYYAYGDPFGNIRILQRFAVAGLASAQAFGAVRPLNILRPAGIPSAQAFGTLTILVGPVFIPVQGLASAQAFGAVWAYKVWLRDLICTDLALAASVCTDLSLAPVSEQTVVLEKVVC
jgi:hypothetical protein